MKMTKTVVMALAAALATVCASCGDSESYANRLNTERNSCNSYLTTKRVENNIPADTVFETGEDAPFYRINPDGNVYMQVIKCTPRKEDRAMKGQTIYFRYTRYNINQWYDTGKLTPYEGNSTDMSANPSYFIYSDFTLPMSSQWGYGLQLPLEYVGVDSEINLLVKSQFGLTSEISYVQPYMFHIRYFRSHI